MLFQFMNQEARYDYQSYFSKEQTKPSKVLRCVIVVLMHCEEKLVDYISSD